MCAYVYVYISHHELLLTSHLFCKGCTEHLLILLPHRPIVHPENIAPSLQLHTPLEALHEGFAKGTYVCAHSSLVLSVLNEESIIEQVATALKRDTSSCVQLAQLVNRCVSV